VRADLSKTEDYNLIKSKAHPRAVKHQNENYEKFIWYSSPPSYRAFLELYNGYDWLSNSDEYPNLIEFLDECLETAKSAGREDEDEDED
jgi:hypothetical protein